jgi:plasmid stability protein
MATRKDVPLKKATFDLPESVRRRLKVRAAEEGRPMRDVLVAAIEAYLKTPLPKNGRAL